jgi:hypothetical protein
MTTAALIALAACSTDPNQQQNKTPTAHQTLTKPGQTAIIAGDYRINKDPVDGAFAVRTSAYSNGGLTVAADGSLYVPVSYGYRSGRIARITTDGHLHLLPFSTIANQVATSGEALWLMTSAASGTDLVHVALSTNKETPYFGWHSRYGDHPTVLDASGDELPQAEQRRLDAYWGNSALGLRADTKPIIASNNGELFEALGDGKLKQWEPKGYSGALTKVRGGEKFDTTAVASDQKGGLLVLGRKGLIRIPTSSKAHGITFPNSDAGVPPWTSAIDLNDGSVLLLGGVADTNPAPRPTRIRPDGRLEPLDWGAYKYCGSFDSTLAIVGSADVRGAARRPDGSIVVNDLNCGQVYAFSMPSQ